MLVGDGNMHRVPVHWSQYIAISQSTSMVVGPVINNVNNNESDDQELVKGWFITMNKHGINTRGRSLPWLISSCTSPLAIFF